MFEYELDNTMALYGTIPLLLAHGVLGGGKDGAIYSPISSTTTNALTTGVFWFNPSETFIDLNDASGGSGDTYKQSHWISESGEIDFFILPGPTPKDIYRQYTLLVGTQQLPPMFGLGFHQCR